MFFDKYSLLNFEKPVRRRGWYLVFWLFNTMWSTINIDTLYFLHRLQDLH